MTPEEIIYKDLCVRWFNLAKSKPNTPPDDIPEAKEIMIAVEILKKVYQL